MNRANKVDVSVYQKVKTGNYECGDSYFYYQDEDHFICALADGLGSGVLAHESSQAVIDVIESNPFMSIPDIVKQSNQALIGKRGVVLGILKLDLNSLNFTYTSIGNIDLMTTTPEGIKKRSIPMSGYLGSYPRIPKEVTGTIEKGKLFFLFSDGVLPTELTHELFRSKEVEQVTTTFKELMNPNREDDTTLIVIKYK